MQLSGTVGKEIYREGDFIAVAPRGVTKNVAVWFLPVSASTGSSRAGNVFLCQDDFETDKAMVESWRHSPFLGPDPVISLYGFLRYEPGFLSRASAHK